MIRVSCPGHNPIDWDPVEYDYEIRTNGVLVIKKRPRFDIVAAYGGSWQLQV